MLMDWGKTFISTQPIAETIVRGTVVYLVLFAMLVKFKRGAGAVGIGDLLLVVLLADAAQNAMADDYHSVTDGLILLATLVFWNVFIDWLATKWRWLDMTLHPAGLPLIRKGRILRQNMRRALVTEAELMAHLREKGVDDVKDVETARMEGDGKISVVANTRDAPLDDEGDQKEGAT